MHMAVQVVTTRNRKGRKRKSGKRYPSGDIVVERGMDVVAIAEFHPERQGLPEFQRAHQNAGHPLGRLNLRGVITDDQLEASRRYARDCRLYLQAYNAPKPSPSAIDMLSGGGRSLMVLSIDEIQSRLKAYDDAHCAVMDAGIKAARAVARTAFYQEWIPPGTTIDDLKRGLTALVNFYGLTTKAKSRYLGNRD